MKAWITERYGPPTDLVQRDVPIPDLAPDQVLVQVRATALNPLDWRIIRADPVLVRLSQGMRRPRATISGSDLAGEVAAVGHAVTRFRPGDEVFGGHMYGGFAEYAAVDEAKLAAKPDGVSFVDAAAIPIAGQTALQALVDEGRLSRGQRVLVNGASGGVGTFAVQIARALGAEVTGVCSTPNVDLVRSLGADVVDYRREDFTALRGFDLVVDAVGNRSLAALRRTLVPRGAVVIVGGGGGRLMGPAAQVMRAAIVAPFLRHRVSTVSMTSRVADLDRLAQMLVAGTVRPVIDRAVPYDDLPEALAYVERGRARGKVVVEL